jgi:hypothetical protein
MLPESSFPDASFDLDDWHNFWASETARWGSPPIYMELLQFFELHVSEFHFARRT